MAGGGNNVARMSPRQRMINLMYIVLTAMLALNVSSDVLNGFSQVQEGLHSTNLNQHKRPGGAGSVARREQLSDHGRALGQGL